MKLKLNLPGTEHHSVDAAQSEVLQKRVILGLAQFQLSLRAGSRARVLSCPSHSPVHPTGQSLCPLGAGSAWLWSQEWVQVSFTPELGWIWAAWPEGELIPEISPRSHLFLLLSKQPKAWAVARATDVESSRLKIAYGVEINCFLINTSFQ